MNALVKSEAPQKLMLLDYMADKYSLNPDEFGKTVRATCGLSTATPEQVAAFLIVAKEYDLNPLLKEIYAFPGKGGGVVPIVSIDGWVNLVNSNPKCDGFSFEMEHDEAGKLVSCTCTMHRKDRAHPVSVTEYLSECKRPTDPWKMEHRMLRHKAMIQAARYAFGFAGIYDEDEGRTIAESDSATTVGPRDVAPPRSVTPAPKVIEHQPAEQIKNTAAPATSESDAGMEHPANESAPEPRELIPEPGKTNSYEGWALAYIALIETSPDKGTLLKWGDANLKRLEKLKGSPEWSAKVTSAVKAKYASLHNGDPISTGRPAEAQDAFPGDTPMDGAETTKAAPTKRTRASKAPDFSKDYDGWLAHQLKLVAAAETPERIEEIYEALDPLWSDIMEPDRETLMGARREAESKLEQ